MNLVQAKQYIENNVWYGENFHRQNYRAASLTLVMPNTFKIWGTDISHWNLPPVNLKRMKDLYNLQFVIAKGCDGSLNSRYYSEHVAAAKLAGVPWGMYVWLYPNNKVSIDAQANAWYARAVEDMPPMGIFIDAEWTYYGGDIAYPLASDLRSAHDKWKAKSGQSATTYTAQGYADTYLRGFDWSREELWIANYGVSAPMLPAGATRYKFWQFTSTLDGKALDPNGNAELDGNYYTGTQTEFDARYQGVTPPPPTNGETMHTGRVKTFTNIRNSPPGGTYQDIGDLNTDDIVTASEIILSNGAPWWHITGISRNGQALPLPGAVCWAYGVNIEETTPPPVTKAVSVTVTLEGYKPLTLSGEMEAE